MKVDFSTRPAREWVIRYSKPIPPLTVGLYYLIKDSEIVYVGQSKDVHSRVLMHRNSGKIDFDSFTVWPVPPELLNEQEANEIVHLCPPHNKIIPGNKWWASLSHLKKFSGLTKPQIKRIIKANGIEPINGYYRINDFRGLI